MRHLFDGQADLTWCAVRVDDDTEIEVDPRNAQCLACLRAFVQYHREQMRLGMQAMGGHE